MARGKPLLWSVVIGLPYLFIGGLIYATGMVQPRLAGLPIAGFGVLAIVIGAYLRSRGTIDEPPLREGEVLLDARHPTQRVARAKMIISIPFFMFGLYLFAFTYLPYVYPIAPIALGLYFYLGGANTYWANTVTTYYLTNQRIIKEYSFFSLVRQELPLERVRGVEERKSVLENLVGLGNIRVASGGGETLEVVIRDIAEATDFAEQIRNNLGDS